MPQAMSSTHPSIDDDMQASSSSVILTSLLSFQYTTITLPCVDIFAGFIPLAEESCPLLSKAKVSNCSLVVTSSAQNIKSFAIQLDMPENEAGTSTSCLSSGDDYIPEKEFPHKVFPLSSAMLVQLCVDNAKTGADAGENGDSAAPTMLSIQSRQRQLYLYPSADPNANNVLQEWKYAICNAMACLLLTDACYTRVYR
jgi:hypothetical protein